MSAKVLSEKVTTERIIALSPKAREDFKRYAREHVQAGVTGELYLKLIMNDGGVLPDAYLVKTEKRRLTE